MAEFGENAIMPQNGDPRIMFEQNVNFINAMNALFVQQEVGFSMAVNQFSALSFQEFAQRQSGMGIFNNQFEERPEFDNRGVLRYSLVHKYQHFSNNQLFLVKIWRHQPVLIIAMEHVSLLLGTNCAIVVLHMLPLQLWSIVSV